MTAPLKTGLWLFVIGLLACQQASLQGQEGFCGYDVADACTRHLGVQWASGPKARFLEDEPITSMANLTDALNELGLEVFPTVLDSRSFPIVGRLFSETGVIGIVCVESTVVDSSTTGVGHFLMVTGLVGDDELVVYDAGNQEVRMLRLAAAARMPILLVSAAPITTPSSWEIAVTKLKKGFASKVLTASLLIMIAMIGVKRLIPQVKPRRLLVFCGVLLIGMFIMLARNQNGKRSDSILIGFDQAVYQLGRHKTGSSASGVAVFVNHSDRSVYAKLLTASCGCMSVDFKPQSIPAGGSLKIPIEFSTVSQGLNRYSLKLETDTGDSSDCELQLIGEAPMRLVPKSALIGTILLNDPQPIVHRVVVQDMQGTSGQIEKIAAEFDAAPLSVSSFDGSSLNENTAIDICFVPNEHAKPGVQFSRFFLLSVFNGEPIKTSFDVGVEFR